MKTFFSLSTRLRAKYARRGALLLGFSGLALGTWGQSFGPVSAYSAGAISSSPRHVALGDVNGDGRLDIVSANFGMSTAGVLLGQAGGSFAPVVLYSTGANSNPGDVVLGDVNGDGQLDIVTANEGSAGVLLGQGGGRFSTISTYATGLGNHADAVVLGDVNSDGRPDIVASGFNFNAVAVLLGQAGGGFATVSTYSTGAGSRPFDAGLGDINGDGRPDIITANFGTNSVGVLLGQAGGGFAAVSTYPNGAANSPLCLSLGDVNSDGRPDIITGSPGSVGVLLGLPGGVFTAVSMYATGPGTQPYDVVLGDVNGDNRPDIVTANFGASAVGVLLGQASGFAPIVLYSTGTSSYPYGVGLGDVNGDGRLDIVAATPGNGAIGVLLNTGTYTPLATAPALAAAADFALFPNPAHAGFTVQLPATFATGPVQAELLNALGQVVRRPAAGGARFRVRASASKHFAYQSNGFRTRFQAFCSNWQR